jgi:hypothetical protein
VVQNILKKPASPESFGLEVLLKHVKLKIAQHSYAHLLSGVLKTRLKVDKNCCNSLRACAERLFPFVVRR